MRVFIEEQLYEGSAPEILEQLRQHSFVADECPDVDNYILFLQARFISLTSRTCDLPAGSTEKRASALIDRFVSIGAMRKEEA